MRRIESLNCRLACTARDAWENPNSFEAEGTQALELALGFAIRI